MKSDIGKLPYTKNFFDVTIANGVLHHTNSPVLGFEKMVGATKSGGIVIVALYNRLGSIPRRLLGALGKVLLKNPPQRIKFFRKLLIKKYKNKTDSVLADAFFNPYETSFSLKEILGWFKKFNIKYLTSYPPIGKFLPHFLVEIIWMFTLKGNVFLVAGRKI